MKSIVSFDVDMTLLDHKTWEIPGSALEAIERLRDRYLIVVATGRDLDAPFSGGLKEQIRPDAVIHMNGTKVTVGEELIYEHLFDKGLLRELLDFAVHLPCSVGATIDGTDYYVNPEFVQAFDIERWGNSDRIFGDPKKLLDMRVRTLSFIGRESVADEVQARFPQLNIYMFAERQGADVVEVCASKAMGLRRLCEHLGVDIKDTVVFGDSMNDYDIVKAAGLGIAMGNAMEELKQAADYVTDDIAEDGIYKACRHFHMI